MQTSLLDKYKQSTLGKQADDILRKCVHCGFCLATCPTYDVLGNELDSPRGRIYLIKQVLEGQTPTTKTQTHLDRCLTCRNCETTCPSGVEYGHLVDAGRHLVEQQVPRRFTQRLLRKTLRTVLPYKNRISPLIRLGQTFKPVLPASLSSHLPAKQKAGHWPTTQHARTMLVLDGCVQPSMAPNINPATARVLDKLGITLLAIKEAGCCGALSYHLNEQEEGLNFARTASGCGVFVHEYAELLKHDEQYAEKAQRVSALCKDISEIVAAEDLSKLLTTNQKSIAFHPPCTLQHGQKKKDLGFDLVKVKDAHFCCGSAGTYSVLQKELSNEFLKRKMANLKQQQPETIATANIGCLLHLQSAAGNTPVVHWIELLDRSLQ